MSFLYDGDAIKTSNIEAPGVDIRAQANAVAEADLAPGALQRQHLPGSLADRADLFPNGLCAGFTRLGTAPANAFVLYRNWFVTPAPTFYNWQLFHSGAPNPPYGPPGVGAEGWRIPQNPGTTKRPQIDTNNVRLDSTGYAGVHLTGSVNIGNYRGDQYFFADQLGMFSAKPDVCILVGLGWQDGAGTRRVFEKSIRAFAHKNKVQRGAVQWFVTQSDLNAGDGKVQAFFVVTASAGMRSDFTVDSSAGYDIAGSQISAIPCHAEVLT